MSRFLSSSAKNKTRELQTLRGMVKCSPPQKRVCVRALPSFFVEHPDVVGTLFAVLFAAVRFQLRPNDQKRTELFLAIAALSLPVDRFCEWLTHKISRFAPIRLDQYIFAIDSATGFQPSFAMGQLLARHFWLNTGADIAYKGLPCAVLVIFAAYVWLCTEAESLTVLRTFFLNLVLAVPIYLLIPVSGPVYAFQGFPFDIPHALVPHSIPLSAPPNGIPSVHTSTALLIVWFAWRWRIGRVLSLSYLAMMVVATLGSGEHYLFDLVIAIPYAILIAKIGKFKLHLYPKSP